MPSKLKLLLLLLLPLLLFSIPIEQFENAHSICLFKNLTGLECFACGSGRALLHLMHLHFEVAMQYNKISLLLLPLFAVLWLKELTHTLKLIGMQKKL